MQVIFWKVDICLFDSTSMQKTQFLFWAHKRLEQKTIHSLFSVWRKNFIILQITESFLSVSVSISCYQYWWGCDGICMMIPHHLINVAQYGSTAATLPALELSLGYILHITYLLCFNETKTQTTLTQSCVSCRAEENR